MASLAGAWIALVAGFGGLRDGEGVLALDPMLPEGIRRLRFRLVWRGVRLLVDVDHRRVTYTIRDGSDARLVLRHAGEPVVVAADRPVDRPAGAPYAQHAVSHASRPGVLRSRARPPAGTDAVDRRRSAPPCPAPGPSARSVPPGRG